MNPFTGHLVIGGQVSLPYEPLPKTLRPAAEKALAGKPETYVDLKEDSSLARWAKKKRKARIAAKSRRRNR